jgi:hypothetical protein
MTGFVHAAIGAALGRFIRNKPLAFAVGVLSHGVGDLIPHHDLGPAEAPLLVSTLGLIIEKHGWGSPQFWGALGAICPDFEHIPAEVRRDPRRFEPMEEKYFPTHNNTLPHAQWPYDERWGHVMNFTLVVGALALAGVFSSRRKA